jgi:hypothetical protein
MSTFPDERALPNESTFAQCYSLIAQAIHDETPTSAADPFHRSPTYQTMVTKAMAPLDKWREHAFDGDPAELPGNESGSTPWTDLRGIRTKELSHLSREMDVISGILRADWNGPAATGYILFASEIAGQLDEYSGPNGLVEQAASVMEAAFAVRLAFKKDLLELARGAYTALMAIDEGPSPGDIGLFSLLFIGFGLNAGADLIAESGKVIAKVVSKTVVAFGAYTYATGTKQISVHGGTPQAVMQSFGGHLDDIINGHSQAAAQVSKLMKDLYQNLCDAADEKDYPDIPVVDTSNTKSFNKVFVPR